MIRRFSTTLLLLVLYAGAALADPERGELLYSIHCNACHTEQIHWREKSLVTNWATLIGQVARWQSNAKLNWDQTDISAVARYLNDLHYHFPLQDS